MKSFTLTTEQYCARLDEYSKSKEKGKRGDPHEVHRKTNRAKQQIEASMAECRRTRSQGPPSLPESNERRHWDSLPDPLQIERDHVEGLRLPRQVTIVLNMSKSMVEISEISQAMSQRTQPIQNMLPIDEISPKQQEKEDHSQNAPKMGEILPKQGDLEAMEEGAVRNMP